MTITSLFTMGTASLQSAGTIATKVLLGGQPGVIYAGTLTGSSVGGASFGNSNRISALGTFTNTGKGNINLKDVVPLTVSGIVSNAAPTGVLTLKTVGNNRNIAIKSRLIAKTVSLTSGSTIVESGAGMINTTTLTGTSAGGADLSGANLVTNLGDFTNTGAGNFTFKNAKALTVTGNVAIAATNGVLTLTTTAGNLTINGSIRGATDTLVSAGEILEGSGASVTAKTILNVTANTGIVLNSNNNHIKKVGIRHTNSGPNVINGIGQ